MNPLPLTAQAHKHLKPYIHRGDILIDATAGNGHDTLFLAQQTGSTGLVFAFDILPKALEITRKRLVENAEEKQSILIPAGHENIEEQIPTQHHGKTKVIIFNLGYLPKAEKEITTRAESTIAALDQSVKILSPQGIISLLIYKGHPAGKEEYTAIKNWLKQNPKLQQNVYPSVDPDEESPVLIQIIQKL